MASFYTEGDSLPLPATGYSAGTLVQVGGKVGIVNADFAVGQASEARITGMIKVANSGVGFADGATVAYSVANDNAVAQAGGDFDIGTSVGIAGTGDVVIVLLNGHMPPTGP